MSCGKILVCGDFPPELEQILLSSLCTDEVSLSNLFCLASLRFPSCYKLVNTKKRCLYRYEKISEELSLKLACCHFQSFSRNRNPVFTSSRNTIWPQYLASKKGNRRLGEFRAFLDGFCLKRKATEGHRSCQGFVSRLRVKAPSQFSFSNQKSG